MHSTAHGLTTQRPVIESAAFKTRRMKCTAFYTSCTFETSLPGAYPNVLHTLVLHGDDDAIVHINTSPTCIRQLYRAKRLLQYSYGFPDFFRIFATTLWLSSRPASTLQRLESIKDSGTLWTERERTWETHKWPCSGSQFVPWLGWDCLPRRIPGHLCLSPCIELFWRDLAVPSANTFVLNAVFEQRQNNCLSWWLPLRPHLQSKRLGESRLLGASSGS